MTTNNLISATNLLPQVLLSQALPTTETALYTVPSNTAAELFHGTLCNVSNNLVTTLSKGTTSTTGGTFAAGTYFGVVTAVSAAGESLVSNEITFTTTGSTGSQPISWTAVPGAVSYNYYRGTSAGAENKLIVNQTGLSVTDTGTAGTTATLPTTSAFGQPITVWLSIMASGGTLGDGTHRVLNAYLLGMNDSLSLTNYIGRAMLGPGDLLAGYAAYASSVDIVVSGAVSS